MTRKNNKELGTHRYSQSILSTPVRRITLDVSLLSLLLLRDPVPCGAVPVTASVTGTRPTSVPHIVPYSPALVAAEDGPGQHDYTVSILVILEDTETELTD